MPYASAMPDRPVRQTKQRAAIRQAIEAAHGPLSAAEILKAARKRVAGIGLATVYRTLASMIGAGEIVEVAVAGEAPRFESAGREHHHHFHCRKCSKLFEVHACSADLARMTPAGFRLESHEITLAGVCAACNR